MRIIHRASGAVGEARDERSQLQNKKAALKRMTEDPRFKFWVAEKMKERPIEAVVDEQMESHNIRTEVRSADDGKWISVDPDSLED